MATLTVSGLSTGIDYESLIQQMIQVERIPVNRLESQKSTYEQKKAAYTDLSSKLDSLESAADALRYARDFEGRTTTVSDTTILTASAATSASTGNYSITVSQIALAHKLNSGTGLASTSSSVASGTGTFTFKIGESGTEYSVSVDADMTLEEFKDALNDLDAGLNAVIINEGTGSTPYRLILSTEETGADNKIIITQDDTDLGYPVNDTTLSSALHLQKPADAEIDLDGLTVYRASNTVTDLIPGVTLYLEKADSSTTVTLQVTEDRESVQDKIRTLIDSYNDVIGFINNRSNYDTETHEADPLYAEGTVRSIVRRLGSIISTGVDGLPSDMKALSQIGVSTNRDGTLTLDEADLQDALDEDLEAVTDLFVQGDSTDGIAVQLYEFTHEVTLSGDGDIAVRTDGLQERISDLEEKIEYQEGALDRLEERLRAQFASLESLISSLQNQNQFFLQNT